MNTNLDSHFHEEHLLWSALIALLVFLAYGPAFAADDIPAENKLLMPEGFEKVELGITQEKLRAIRPAEPITNLHGRASSLWKEKDLSSAFYDSVIYRFSDVSTGRLEQVTFNILGQDICSRNPGFIKGCIAKWGKDFNIIIHKIEQRQTRTSKNGQDEKGEEIEERYVVSLIWSKPFATIIATYTPRQSASKDSIDLFRVRITTPNSKAGQPREIADPSETLKKQLLIDLEKIHEAPSPYFR